MHFLFSYNIQRIEANLLRSTRDDNFRIATNSSAHRIGQRSEIQKTNLLGKRGNGMETPYRPLGEEAQPVLDDGVPLLGKAKPALEGTATLSSCIANLMNTCMGTGMLALPHAFASGS